MEETQTALCFFRSVAKEDDPKPPRPVRPKYEVYFGEVAEWSNALPWKGSVRETVPRVRIPPSPHLTASTKTLML